MDKLKIDASTVICAVIGNPIEHSLSPAIHNAAFAACGLNWAYVAYRVAELKQAIEGIRALGIRGVSVTIPHKVAVMSLLDTVDEAARTIGSINTIVNTNGHLAGYNSDGEGALQALRDAGSDPTGKRVVILGSGGAARAITIALALKAPPEKLTILGAVEEEVLRLSSDSSRRGAVAVAGELLIDTSLSSALHDCEILIHATPIGMHPKSDQSLVPAHLLHKNLVVFDIVYNPLKTRLLMDAERAGCTVLPGIEMFLNQAAVQFKLWTGQEAPRKVMRAVLEKHFA
jgi:shikimate dehydrogenase